VSGGPQDLSGCNSNVLLRSARTMQDTIQQTQIEQIHEEARSPEVTVEARPSVDGAEQLQSALEDIANEFDTSDGFKCAHPQCGLVHEHNTNKHRASDSFNMSDVEAASMEANPNCHCGLGELARRDDVSDAPSPSRANDKAPVPDSMARHLDKSL
jgi:hypothetical protein